MPANLYLCLLISLYFDLEPQSIPNRKYSAARHRSAIPAYICSITLSTLPQKDYVEIQRYIHVSLILTFNDTIKYADNS